MSGDLASDLALAYARPLDCVFCDIVAGRVPAEIVGRWPEVLAFTPLNPVTEGHALVVSRQHVVWGDDVPWVYGPLFARAVDYARRHQSFNIVTSCGHDATQTVAHVHLHVVPRRADDGLVLPWTDLRSECWVTSVGAG